MTEQVEILNNFVSEKLENYVSKLEERIGEPGRVPLISDLASIYSNYVNQIKIEGYLLIFHEILVSKVIKLTTQLQQSEGGDERYERLRTQSARFSDVACSISAGTSLLDNKPKINKKIIQDIKDMIIELML